MITVATLFDAVRCGQDDLAADERPRAPRLSARVDEAHDIWVAALCLTVDDLIGAILVSDRTLVGTSCREHSGDERRCDTKK